MLIRVDEIDQGQKFDCDVCIVGGGAAGIALAQKLRGSNCLVMLVEGGGLNYNRNVQALYRGLGQGALLGNDLAYLTTSRLRYLGGSTNHWDGGCRPLDGLDFEKRSWVENSGWPFARGSLDDHYRAAARWLGLPAPEGVDSKRLDWSSPVGWVKGDAFESRHLIYGPSTGLGQLHRDRLKAGRDLMLFLDSNAIGLDVRPEGSRVRQLRVGTLKGKRFAIRATYFVLAAGGVENARLLLLSDQVREKGLGNEEDLVGRYFMDHPHLDQAAQMVLSETPEGVNLFRRALVPSRKDRSLRVLGVTEATQRQEKLRNTFVRIEPETDRMRAAELRRMGQVFKQMAELFDEETTDPGDDGLAPLRCMVRTEVTPHKDSRITLEKDKLDPLGLRRPKLHWKLHKDDGESVWRSLNLLATEIGKHTQGKVKITTTREKPWEGGSGASYHIGTTRMHEDPRQGVVDADARVHGIENLYIAGSSVFPTSGVSPPTLTILALTLRLADKLKERLAHG